MTSDLAASATERNWCFNRPVLIHGSDEVVLVGGSAYMPSRRC